MSADLRQCLILLTIFGSGSVTAPAPRTGAVGLGDYAPGDGVLIRGTICRVRNCLCVTST